MNAFFDLFVDSSKQLSYWHAENRFAGQRGLQRRLPNHALVARLSLRSRSPTEATSSCERPERLR
jgi:hypothetical protein